MGDRNVLVHAVCGIFYDFYACIFENVVLIFPSYVLLRADVFMVILPHPLFATFIYKLPHYLSLEGFCREHNIYYHFHMVGGGGIKNMFLNEHFFIRLSALRDHPNLYAQTIYFKKYLCLKGQCTTDFRSRFFR